MLFKLDENLGHMGRAALSAAGHDVSTVVDQERVGITDTALYELCKLEGRALATLDLDFSETLRFPPEGTGGIAILRPRGRITFEKIEALFVNLVAELDNSPLTGRLWIIEPHRIRIRQQREP